MDESKLHSSSDMVERICYSLLGMSEGNFFPSMVEKIYCLSDMVLLLGKND